MSKVRTSLFWKIPRETIEEITKTSNSIAEIIRKCEMVSSGASYKVLKRRNTIKKWFLNDPNRI